jgi:hypothetical protein
MPISARQALAGVGVVASALALTACTHTPSKAATSTTLAPTTTTSGSSTSPTTTTSTTSTTTTSPLSPTTCLVSQLHIAVAGSEGAAGTTELTFSLANSSSAVCTMYGYPGMLLLSASGAGLPTIVTRGGGLAFETIAPTNVSLRPGQIAYFNLGYNDVTQGMTTCSSATQVEITPPNDTTHAVVSVPQINACGNGALNVSPVFATTNPATSTTAPPLS